MSKTSHPVDNDGLSRVDRETKPVFDAHRAPVLMVDDQPARLLTYESILSGLPIDCVRALSGNEALEHLLKKEFAVILLDVSMPGMDGFELARMVREHPRLERTPIIFITGVHISELDRLKGYEVGAIDYISVPVVPEILRTKVALLVELHQRRRELRALNDQLAQARQRESLQTQAALRDSQEGLLLAKKAANLGTFDWNIQADVLLWDERTHEIWGTQASDGTSLAAFFAQLHPEDHASAQRAIDRSLDPLGDHVLSALYRVNNRIDGLTRWVEATGRVYFEGNRPSRMVGVVQEVSERVLSQQRLAESEHRFRELANHIDQIVWTGDVLGQPTWYNDRWYEFTGLPAGKVCRDDWTVVIPAAQLGSLTSRANQAFAAGIAWEDTFQVRRSDGKYRWFLGRAIPIRNEKGEILRWLGTSTDITEQRRLQEALERADQRKDEFLAMLAHELRNPVAPISNAAEILSRTLRNEPRSKPLVQIIQRQVLQLSRLLDDLLDVARVTRGRITLQLEDVTLADCIHSAVETVQPLIQERGHQFTQIDSAPSLSVSADRVRLAQCIGNVLINAAKFTPAAGAIEIRSYADNGEAVIGISDNGIGIEPDLLPHIFDLFVQGERSLDRNQGGLGVGLAICRQLIEMHGGTVTAASPGSGQGSSFHLRIPLTRAGAAARAPMSDAMPCRHRILLVDDNRDAAESLAILLQLEGHVTRCVHSGAAALEALESFAPSVVLLDIGLPGMDGYEVVARMRAQARQPDLKIIALTGYGQAADRERALAAGFDEHLVKPTSPEGIATALNRL